MFDLLRLSMQIFFFKLKLLFSCINCFHQLHASNKLPTIPFGQLKLFKFFHATMYSSMPNMCRFFPQFFFIYLDDIRFSILKKMCLKNDVGQIAAILSAQGKIVQMVGVQPHFTSHFMKNDFYITWHGDWTHRVRAVLHTQWATCCRTHWLLLFVWCNVTAMSQEAKNPIPTDINHDYDGENVAARLKTNAASTTIDWKTRWTTPTHAHIHTGRYTKCVG